MPKDPTGQAPGPRGIPPIGVLHRFSRDPIALVDDNLRKHGGLVRMNIGPYLVHQVSSPSAVKQVLLNNYKNYRRGKFYRAFHPFFGRGTLTTDAAMWKSLRSTTQALFLKPRLPAHGRVLAETIEDTIAQWEAADGAAVNVSDDMMVLAMRMLGRVLYGFDFRDHAEELLPAVRFAMKVGNSPPPLSEFLPRWVPTPHRRRLARYQAVLNDVMDRVIDLHEAGKGDPDSVITAFLSTPRPDKGRPWTRHEIRDELKTLFLAGHETTGCCLAWTLYAIARDPDVRARLDAELAPLGDREITAEDINDLPYLRQVIDESMRLYTPIWMFPRDANEDDVLDGHPVPAGSSLFVCPHATHHDPDMWPDPYRFDPDRFASPPDRFAYIPFGGGPRKCMGMDLALLELRLAIAMIVRRFRFTVVTEPKAAALVAVRPEGLTMRLEPAKSPVADQA